MPDIDKSDSRRLAELMAVGAEEAPIWRPEELAEILQHQLAAPLEFDLAGPDRASPERLRSLTEAQQPAIKTFGDLLHHPRPPVELLRLTKDFAKAAKGDPDRPLPEEIATVLYFASIAVGMTRCGERITELDDAALRRGLQWLIDQAWVDEETRSLFREGLDHLPAVGSNK